MASSILSDKFSNYYRTHRISESRLERLKDPDKNKATHLGLWDKFKDLFLTNKKQDALNALHDAIHGDSASSKLEAFGTLKSCAGQAYQDRFTKQIDDAGKISLLIDKDLVTTCSVKEALYIDDDVSLHPMTNEEKGLFIRILDVTKEQERLIGVSDGAETARRNAVRESIREALYAVYRPDEKSTRLPADWKGGNIDELAENLKCLNANSFDLPTQFYKIGYQYDPMMEALEFKMVHPVISYMMGAYVNADDFDGSRGYIKEDWVFQNSFLLKEHNSDYESYLNKKNEIDKQFSAIYELHDKTLCIQLNGSGRNYLCMPGMTENS
ncbi:hypothetical protein [Alcaligenes sp. Marseille-Q7550]